MAWSPYLLLVVFVLLWGDAVDQAGAQSMDRQPAAGSCRRSRREDRGQLNGLLVPGLHNLITQHAAGDAGRPRRTRARLRVELAQRVGHGLLPGDARRGRALLRVGPARVAKIYVATFKQLKFAMLTIASMLGLAYLMNYSGMTSTLGLALAATGARFRSSARRVGWLGVFLTGSDTSANALFGNLQVVTANALQPEPGADRVGQFRGRRHGQDDFGSEHRRRRRGDRHVARRREPAVPLHDQAQRPADGRRWASSRCCTRTSSPARYRAPRRGDSKRGR